MNNTEMVEYEDQRQIVMNPMDATPAQFRAGLDRRKENRDTLMDWIRSALVEGRDFGSIMIRGQKSKPSLLKPGAEKIAGMLGLIPRFPNLKEYEESAISGNDIDLIILKCELHNQSGEVVGEGVGARSCEKQDNGDLNKALKMAGKSAMIDATLRCAGISEVFTQDIEEMAIPEPALAKAQVIVSKEDIDLATEKQTIAVRNLIDHPKVRPDEKRKLHKLLEDEITKAKAKEVLDYFYGQSQYINGEWVKQTRGALDDR
ncbi:MAG: hypothetical protein HOD11_11515 [Candidatus Marinimicrobia bacterium]|nr:hypothetical protein [Candidatus Neomarinimicrobiota bacterium]